MASQPLRPQPTPASTGRHHPYPAPASRPKWRTSPPSEPAPAPAPAPAHHAVPPSPPRSRRGPSETPSLGLGLAFGASPNAHATGHKWWDDELPAPPASLGSILDSFKRSGEGDRDLLLAILGAKKAEEERLTALIQTRLTILQARLSLHSAAAALNASPVALSVPSPAPNTVFPLQLPTSASSPSASAPTARMGPTLPPLSMARNERTPSLSSRASSSGASSPLDELVSPPSLGAGSSPQLQSQPQIVSDRSPRSPGPAPTFEPKERFALSQHPPLPLPQQHPAWRDTARVQLPPMRTHDTKAVLQQAATRGSLDRREKNGLEMLLDAGMQRETEALAA